jgi:uncharacterized protein
MTQNRLAQFENEQFLNLETQRKSGVGVQTPVWFVEENGEIFVRTGAQSGKVKRIRNNPQVRIAPCDTRGGLRGEWKNAQAKITDADTAERVNRLLKKKYGLQKNFFDALGRLSRNESTTLVIRVDKQD